RACGAKHRLAVIARNWAAADEYFFIIAHTISACIGVSVMARIELLYSSTSRRAFRVQTPRTSVPGVLYGPTMRRYSSRYIRGYNGVAARATIQEAMPLIRHIPKLYLSAGGDAC